MIPNSVVTKANCTPPPHKVNHSFVEKVPHTPCKSSLPLIAPWEAKKPSLRTALKHRRKSKRTEINIDLSHFTFLTRPQATTPKHYINGKAMKPTSKTDGKSPPRRNADDACASSFSSSLSASQPRTRPPAAPSTNSPLLPYCSPAPRQPLAPPERGPGAASTCRTSEVPSVA